MSGGPNREGKTPVLELDIVWLDSQRVLIAYPEGADAKTSPGEHDGVSVNIVQGKVRHP
jgi:hypothetical protein